MKFSIFLVKQLLLFSFCYSQNGLLFKEVTQSDNLKLICLTDHLDSFQVNKRFSFYCKDKSAVADILNSFKVGRKVEEVAGGNELNLYVLKGKEIQSIQIIFNPDGFKGVTYIERLLKKLTKREEFLVGFSPTFDQDIFTFSVQCSEELFDKLTV